MNPIKNFFIFSIFLLPTFAFAEINCPRTEIVTDLQFQRADGAAGIWDLFSKTFHYNNKNWQVIFTVYLPEANKDNAIQQGDYYYHTQVAFFNTPLGRRNNNNQLVCYYAQQESSYFVRAIAA